ncbi:efflux transporter outer membrane subunit [Allopusillimonas soli]|uniref:Efflux transporter outer membrane subunit n=1 Tax=Allopusillimonas soli TaxID=659016 RepID=A0A853FBW8_9BURK|nr:efflux transporter outer membrane subunit [Allopusillimonas soli]NYT35566.1 efflux transporter outer membrane subunit [Allopusillimonas soli]TEA75969.1 efflux transporter outer membrane subunit [Allopusillimonas soli]
MKIIFPLLLAASLAGCAAIGPGDANVESLDAGQLGLKSVNVDWPSDTWWQRYGDPQLNALIEQALNGNPSMDAAQARLAAANAAVRGAHAIRLPQADASFVSSRQRFSNNYIYPPPYGGSMMTDANLRLNVGFDLDLWGRNRARYAAAVSQEKAAEADVQMARNTLVDAVVQSYFNLQNALAQHEVLARIVEQQRNVLDITRQRANAGLDTQVEVKQASSAVSAARVQLSQASTNAALLRNQLAALAGQGPERGQQIHKTTPKHPPTGVPDSIPLELLARRPDIVAAKLRVEAASSQISAAKAEFYPNVNLNAFAGFMSLGLSNLLEGASKVYGVGPAISLPVFHGGELNAQLDTRRAERDLAVADYNQTLLDAIREVANATASINALQQQTRDQEDSLQAIESAYQIAVDRYKSGLGNFIQVLQAQNEVQTQAIQTTDLHVRAYKLDAQLATALGGGYGAATKKH